MESVPLPPNAARVPADLSKLSLFGGPAFCVHAAAVCAASGAGGAAASSRLIAVNRCATSATVPIVNACGGRSGWQSVEVYNASLDAPGAAWARVTDSTPDDGPMWPARLPGGSGSEVALAPYSLSVVLL